MIVPREPTHLRRLVASWRERSERNRPTGPVDTDGKMALSLMSTMYASLADELESALNEQSWRPPVKANLSSVEADG